MIPRAAIVAEARAWRDVPVFYKGRDRAGGVDCLGLILVVGQATGALPGGIAVPDYGRLPNPRILTGAMDAHGVPLIRSDDSADLAARVVASLDDGDVIGMSWGLKGAPMHLAIAATYEGRRTLIHADAHAGRVVEVTLGGRWASAACASWRYPCAAV